jgi:hypothetical protein
MAEKARIHVRSRTIFACNGKAAVASDAAEESISIDTSVGLITVTIAAGERIDNARSQMLVTAAMEHDVSGKPAVSLQEYWSYWDARTKATDTSTKTPPPALSPEASHLFVSTGSAKSNAAQAVVTAYRWRWQLVLQP